VLRVHKEPAKPDGEERGKTSREQGRIKLFVRP